MLEQSSENFGNRKREEPNEGPRMNFIHHLAHFLQISMFEGRYEDEHLAEAKTELDKFMGISEKEELKETLSEIKDTLEEIKEGGKADDDVVDKLIKLLESVRNSDK